LKASNASLNSNNKVVLINIDPQETNQATSSEQKHQPVNNKLNKNIVSLSSTPVSNIDQRVNSAATTASQSSKTSLSAESAGQIQYKHQSNQQFSLLVNDLANEQIHNNNLSYLLDNQEDLIIDPNSKLGILVQAKVLEDKVTSCFFLFNFNLARKYFSLLELNRCIPL
jgi:hypothetical protein